jgi:hypothetical protein
MSGELVTLEAADHQGNISDVSKQRDGSKIGQ